MTTLLKVAFGLAVAAYALHLATAGLDRITTPVPTMIERK